MLRLETTKLLPNDMVNAALDPVWRPHPFAAILYRFAPRRLADTSSKSSNSCHLTSWNWSEFLQPSVEVKRVAQAIDEGIDVPDGNVDVDHCLAGTEI
jgi:hypothetical protein